MADVAEAGLEMVRQGQAQVVELNTAYFHILFSPQRHRTPP
jgi:hypothetical protein